MKNISMVFQNVYLFQDTIENNIKFGRPDATREEVEAAAKRACCHEFIMALPDGYDTVAQYIKVAEPSASISVELEKSEESTEQEETKEQPQGEEQSQERSNAVSLSLIHI